MAEEDLSFGVSHYEAHAARYPTPRAGSNYITRRWVIGGSKVTIGRSFELAIALQGRGRCLIATADSDVSDPFALPTSADGSRLL